MAPSKIVGALSKNLNARKASATSNLLEFQQTLLLQRKPKLAEYLNYKTARTAQKDAIWHTGETRG